VSHTAECEKTRAMEAAAREAYEKEWPNYCQRCGGWGSIASGWDGDPESSDVGPCSCVEEGRCPRCGERSLNEDGDYCFGCQWIDGKSDGLPEVGACLCWTESHGTTASEEGQ